MITEADDEFVKRVLLAAHERGFVLHEEKRGRFFLGDRLTDGRAAKTEEVRFTFILTDGRLVSVQQWHSRRAALSVVCRVLEPWLGKFEASKPRLEN